MQPVLAIELDNASHNSMARRDRDAFLDQALAAGQPILHIKAGRASSITEAQQQPAIVINQSFPLEATGIRAP